MRNKFSKSAKWYAGGFYVSLSILLVTILSIRDVVLVDKIPLDKGFGSVFLCYWEILQ